MNKLTIIVPVYNEQQTIAAVLRRLTDLELPDWEKEIIVVDDGSTPSLSPPYKGGEGEGVKLVTHEKNQGKGAAIRTGLKEAAGDYVLIQDADLEYELNDVPILLNELKNPEILAVFGSRNLQPRRRGYPHYVLGVKFLTMLVNLLYGSKLTDVYTCYKLIKTELLRALNLESRGFEFEVEVTTKLLRRGVKIQEIPINYYPRTFAEGKKIGWRDGAKGLWTIFKHWL